MRSLSLMNRWRRLTDRLGAVGGVGDGLLEYLVERYGEPQRHYHDLDHIAEVLEALDRLVDSGEPSEDLEAVELAVWFHDAVYEPGAGDNEVRSAQLAIEMLGDAGIGSERLERVSELVLATEHHLPGGQDAALLVDADLAILGTDRRRYLEYAAAIRAEYAVYDDERYREGRTEVLRGLLYRPLLYHTRTMRDARTRQARANLRAELQALTSAPGVTVDVALRRTIG